MSQNTSAAVMVQRTEPRDSLDDFPTPPWATRALCKWMAKRWPIDLLAVWDPACGRGHMTLALGEYFGASLASDIHDYGVGMDVEDFLKKDPLPEVVNWIITNPPFRLAAEFYERAVKWNCGIALLCRTVFLESVGRYERIFKDHPPIVLPFAERVPMVKGRLDPNISSATAYAWFVWPPIADHGGVVEWIPPCRKRLERPEDYA